MNRELFENAKELDARLSNLHSRRDRFVQFINAERRIRVIFDEAKEFIPFPVAEAISFDVSKKLMDLLVDEVDAEIALAESELKAIGLTS